MAARHLRRGERDRFSSDRPGLPYEPRVKRPVGHRDRQLYEPFIAGLEEEVERFGKPVLVVQGEDHRYVVDHPLKRLANFTRMQVPGSPDVGWVRVVVTPSAKSPFAFEEHVVPRWKYW